MSTSSPRVDLPARIGLRWVATGAVLLSEYLIISLLFDAQPWIRKGGPLSILGYFGELATIGAVAIFGTFLLRGEVVMRELRACHEPRRLPATALFALFHLVAYLGLIVATARTFAMPDPPAVTLPVLLIWMVAVVASTTTLLLVITTWRSLRRLVPRLLPAFGLGLGAAVVIFGFGRLSTAGWDVLGEITLRAVHHALHHLTDDVRLEPARALIGTAGFRVQVGAPCSGMEGIGLILVVLGGYLALNRASLRFPRVLWVLPLAVAAIWILNVVRIVALILLGAHVSPALAIGGFHSRAGWVFFCLVAVGFIAWLRGSVWAVRDPAAEHDPELTGQASALLLPQLALLSVALFTGLLAEDVDLAYGVRIAAALVPLWIWRARIGPLLERPSIVSVLIGVGVFAVWYPLTEHASEDGTRLREAVEALGGGLSTAWIVVRVLGSVLVVPLVEELAFRAYLMRRLVDSDFAAVPLGRLHVPALLLSSLAFGLLHGEWIAAMLAGLGYGLAQVHRGRVGDAVTAHAVTNALVAVDVLWLGAWAQW